MTQAQFARLIQERRLVELALARSPVLPAAIDRQAAANVRDDPSLSTESERRRISDSVSNAAAAEEDREAFTLCQNHLQPFVAPALIAVPLMLSMRAEAASCVQTYRATGRLPAI